MKRKPKTLSTCCPTCKRGGWKIEEQLALYTEEEWKAAGLRGNKLTNLSQQAERCLVRGGATIYKAVDEGIALAKKLRRPVTFIFNDSVVIVDAHSDSNRTIQEWWMRVYGETQEQSFAKRY